MCVFVCLCVLSGYNFAASFISRIKGTLWILPCQTNNNTERNNGSSSAKMANQNDDVRTQAVTYCTKDTHNKFIGLNCALEN